MTDALQDAVAAELAVPVAPPVTKLAAAIAARHPGARAVLFYGSCLRERQLDGLMLDFYLIVADYRTAFASRWQALANRWLPPNVYPFAADGLAAKYAVLSEEDFRRLCGPETLNVSVWARFAQTARLVWAADSDAERAAVAAVARAAPTLLGAAGRVADEPLLDWWRRGFALTYSAELRAERKERGPSVVDADPARYAAIGALAAPRIAANAGRWRLRRWQGKALSVLRLAKATTTFAGGADYIAWKINRHAGTAIALKPWQRRHPLLGALTLLPKLLRAGAIR